jgi:hypothetical protein
MSYISKRVGRGVSRERRPYDFSHGQNRYARLPEHRWQFSLKIPFEIIKIFCLNIGVTTLMIPMD